MLIEQYLRMRNDIFIPYILATYVVNIILFDLWISNL
jgi:hypothetical protein